MANSITIKDTKVKIGDTIAITYKFKDKDKEKSQIFKGIVISIKGSSVNKMFTVRKMTRSKIGVERIFPIISPFIDKVDVLKSGTVKKAKAYFIRDKSEREIAERLYTPLHIKK